MDNSSLKDIRNRLRALPILENRLSNLFHQIAEAEGTLSQLKNKYAAEEHDVDQLMKETFTATLLHFIGKYEGKLTKEKQEELLAKAEYEKACDRLHQLRSESDELSNRILSLKNDRRQFDNELHQRVLEMERNISSATYDQFYKIEDQIDSLSKQLVETDEALRAAGKVIETSSSALESLESAEGWATYDVWTRGGILSHIEKYDQIDQAQSMLNRLDSQLKDLHRELSDVNLQETATFTAVDSTTRTVDFWFDNIFTDLNVRSIIRDNQEQLTTLGEKIKLIVTHLVKNKAEIQNRINQLEKDKEDVLLA